MPSTASHAQTTSWLLTNGPKALEQLFRTIVYHPAAPLLVTDDQRRSREASVGIGRLLGLPRNEIIGRKVDDFAPAEIKPVISARWQVLLKEGEQSGTLQLLGSDGAPREIEYIAKANVLPVRHLLVLRDKTKPADPVPSCARDYALFLLDSDGKVALWYAGAERIFGYRADEAVGRHLSLLYPALVHRDDALQPGVHEGVRVDEVQADVQVELSRIAGEGHRGVESWGRRKDGTRFWANAITIALRDPGGTLRGFARVVRDFSDRHSPHDSLRRGRTRPHSSLAQSAIVAVISGELDRLPAANDAFLDLVAYTRDDLTAGRLVWAELTPPEYFALDEIAHEEGLRCGACTPFEKELIRKDGVRIPVLVATAVLNLAPFRWITFITDLRERNRKEKVEEAPAENTLDFGEVVGNSAPIRRVMGQVELVAPTDATVLILGETGTGKELIARAVHRNSPRRNLPFVSLNCAAIPTGLLESELFGYERGAFTGALAQKIGRFEMAHRGTLFLDEVGDIPIDLQPKLLRALQEKSFERLGGTRTIPIDVRLVAATNRNLSRMMGEKLFRSDLYYRLKVFPIVTPPLRDHAGDIPILARHFTRKHAMKMNRTIDKIPIETMKALVSWSWPGNVRELENFIERSVILSPGAILQAPVWELRAAASETASHATLEDVERDHILHILREVSGVVSSAAARLGVPRTTLNAMMKKLSISRSDL